MSEECQKPQPPLLLKKYRNRPPICIAVRFQFVLQCFWCPYALRKGKYCQYASHLYCNTPPICIAGAFGKILVVTGCSPLRMFRVVAGRVHKLLGWLSLRSCFWTGGQSLDLKFCIHLGFFFFGQASGDRGLRLDAIQHFLKHLVPCLALASYFGKVSV